MLALSQIDSAVCGKFSIPPTALKGDNRERRIARPRQVAMYLGRQLTANSLPQIGRHYGGRDHTTVLHACRKVESLMTESRLFAIEVENLKDELTLTETRLRWPLKVLGHRFAAEHAARASTASINVLDLAQTG